MKSFLIAVAAILLFSFNCPAQEHAREDCNRHAEPLGGFSFCVPEGWSVEEREGNKYKMVFAPRATTFTPNINVKDETSSYSLNDYVAASIKTILDKREEIGATSIKPAGQIEFVTNSRLKGIRVAFLTEYRGLMVRTLQYYFDAGNNHKILATGTALEETKETYDKVFDTALRSFQIDR
ncbi:MAG: hypothetical protein WBP93_20205 [Pyrinomonadaceae bacterium]